MFWLVEQLVGLILVVAGIALLVLAVIAGLFVLAAAICLVLFTVAILIDVFYSIAVWKWNGFASVKWLDAIMQTH